MGMNETCERCLYKEKLQTEDPCNTCNVINDNLFECKLRFISDNINSPAHYTQGKIETIDYLESCLTHEEFKGFLKGNIIKYASRERLKGGLEDIKKSEWYKNKLITLMEGKDVNR